MRYTTVILGITFLFGVFCVFKSPNDPDFGWHYKYGEYLIQHGKILRENIFSYTFTDYKWANSYWISQAALYLTHNYLGHLIAGLVFAVPLSLASIMYIRALSRKIQFPMLLTAVASLILFIEFSGGEIASRPMYFSSLFLMLLMVLLLRDSGKKRFWLLPPLFLIWANTHADFVLGLFILGLYVVDRGILSSAARVFQECSPGCGSQSLSVIARYPAMAGDRGNPGLLRFARNDGMLVIVGILSVAVTLINPYGLELWQTLLKESHPYQFNHINEWVPVTTENTYYFATYCALLGIFVVSLIGARHKLPLWYVLSLGLFCILSIRSQYFFRIAVILGIYSFLVFWSPYLYDLKGVIPVDLLKKIKIGFIAFLLLSTLTAGTVFLTEVSQSTNFNYLVEKQRYPRDALDFAAANNIKGNVFNDYGWGGYMIWKYPEYKTFVDGRMPSWREGNKSVFEDYVKVVNRPKKNLNILSDYNVSWVLYPTDSELVKYLKTLNGSWKEIYSDNLSSIFVETTRFDIMSP